MEKGLSAYWFLRPEQTTHKTTQKFYFNEVFKTQHVEHYMAADIVGKCCVLPPKDYVRGKPADVLQKDIFICESRYIESSKNYQRIKTWTANLSAGVREFEYTLVNFEQPMNIVKNIPSHLKEDTPPASVKPTPVKKRKASIEPIEMSNKKVFI